MISNQSKTMHVGFDVSQTGSHKAGCGFFAYALIQAMLDSSPQTKFSLYPHFGDFYFDAKIAFSNPFVRGKYGPRYLIREQAKQFWNHDELEQKLKIPDVIHANNFWCPTQLKTSRLIYTFYDMAFLVDPAWSTEVNRIGCYQGIFRASVAADWIVAISKASRDHFLKIFPSFPEERIRVIYPCSRFDDPSVLGTRPKTLRDIPEEGFWLSVGTIEPRKNQLRLAEAYARYLALGGKPMPLVFAGGRGWLMDDFQNHLRALGVEDNIILTGYISDAELIWLYRSCYANLYPTLFEGFGLPVLEGMQFAAPTITSQTSSIPEVAGSAAWLLDPLDIESWAKAMLDLSLHPEKRDRMKQDSLSQSHTFSWKESAQALLSLYDEALSCPKRSEAFSP